MRAQLEPGDAGNDAEDQQRADEGEGLAEPDHPDDHRAERADPAPYGIGGAHRNAARRHFEQGHRQPDRGEEAERPGQVAKAVDKAEASGETDFETASEDQ